MTTYDTIIIGAGPAGLSAAIYLARYRRTVLVIDDHDGRSTYPQHNDNYLGFPEGIDARELRVLGKKQAKRFDAEFITDTIESISKKDQLFQIQGKSEAYTAKTIIFATGVTDILPSFQNAESYFGHSMFWCIICDGYKAIDKKIVIVGNNDEAVQTCLQFMNYTKKIEFVTNCVAEQCGISPEKLKLLEKYAIPCHMATIIGVEGTDNQLTKMYLNNKKELTLDLLFNEQGSHPNSTLAIALGVEIDSEGFIKTYEDQRTSMAGVYAAGDVTKIYSHQITAAVHEGAMAAQAANYDLYPPDQK
ncbi:MAG: NAD(P)/FAD-dependent oxidoreductase [Weeksellaceae bacterium]